MLLVRAPGPAAEDRAPRVHDKGQRPEPCTHPGRQPPAPVSLVPDGEEDARAARPAHGCQQAQAGGVGEVLHSVKRLPGQGLRVGQRAGVQTDQGRQAEQEEQGGHGRVEDIHAVGRPLHAAAQKPHHQAVARYATHAGERDQGVTQETTSSVSTPGPSEAVTGAQMPAVQSLVHPVEERWTSVRCCAVWPRGTSGDLPTPKFYASGPSLGFFWQQATLRRPDRFPNPYGSHPS